MAELVIGADLGGTSTRLTVATTAGDRLVTVEGGGGGNPTTHGVQRAAAELARTARSALTDLDPGEVRAVVIGVAGRATLDDQQARQAFADALSATQIRINPDFVGDAEVAFCSATPEPDGTVLLAGTGAMAVRICDRRVDATSDGLGWLLGDEGSAYWLGREAVRASIAAICGTGPPTALTRAVSDALLDGPPPTPPYRHRSALIRAVNAQPPVALAALAPLVTLAETQGDVVAAAICDAAAERLIKILADVRDPADPAPLVTAGSVVRDPRSAVGRRLRLLIAARFTGTVLTPADGVVGAAWLAVRSLDPGRPLTAVHARLQH
jgi:glucosamine kinase